MNYALLDCVYFWTFVSVAAGRLEMSWQMDPGEVSGSEKAKPLQGLLETP